MQHGVQSPGQLSALRLVRYVSQVEHARNRGAACREARQQEVESKRVVSMRCLNVNT